MADVVQQMSPEKEYLKNPDITPGDIKKLRDWLKTQPHLPGDKLTDLDLILVYHCCERSQGVSKQVLDLHYTLKTLFTTFFKDRRVDKKVEFTIDKVCFPILKTNIIYINEYIRLYKPTAGRKPSLVLGIEENLPISRYAVQVGNVVQSLVRYLTGCTTCNLFAALPTPTAEGYRVVYLRLLDPDPRNFMFNDAVRIFMMMFDLWQYEEGTWPGFIILIDMDKAVIGHLARLEIMSIRQVLYFLQEAMLIKLKGLHFLNAPHFMDKLMMMLKPFLHKTLLDMIYIHQIGSDTLYKHVPKKALPKYDGGEHKDHETIRDELLQRLKANQKFFDEEARSRVNENLRPGKPTTFENLFGIQGSFKKLDID